MYSQSMETTITNQAIRTEKQLGEILLQIIISGIGMEVVRLRKSSIINKQ